MIRFITELARTAGAEAMRYFQHLAENRVSTKSSVKDVVSTADKTVEALIIRAIREKFPDHAVFGEETGKSGDSPFQWVIDPIDGTQSFIKNHPYFSISIALKENGVTRFGVVYAPAMNLLFSAERGRGALENGTPIRPSDCESLETALCATGFACLRAGRTENNLPIFNRIMPKIRDIRRCGSAALDLCFVASGRYDGYWEFCLQDYDIAAGALIALEAGAKVTDFYGKTDYPQSGILAAAPGIHDALQSFFR